MQNIFKPFSLLWMFLTFAGSVAVYFCYELGFFHWIAQKDFTYLSFVILALVMLGHLYLGRLIFLYDGGKDVSYNQIDRGYELANQLTAIGLIGTVVGFIAMLNNFAGVDLDNIEQVKKLYDGFTGGMGTALLTTLVGTCGSVFVRTSFYILDTQNEKRMADAKKIL